MAQATEQLDEGIDTSDIPELPSEAWEGAERGKYHDRATAGDRVVELDADVHQVFPDAESVNRALRVLIQAGQAATPRDEADDDSDHSTPQAA
jgi:hypothetical protein